MCDEDTSASLPGSEEAKSDIPPQSNYYLDFSQSFDENFEVTIEVISEEVISTIAKDENVRITNQCR